MLSCDQCLKQSLRLKPDQGKSGSLNFQVKKEKARRRSTRSAFTLHLDTHASPSRDLAPECFFFCYRKHWQSHRKTSVKSGLPWWSVIKNLPANAGDMGSVLGQGRRQCHGATKSMQHLPSPHSTELKSCNYRSPCALEPVLHNKRSPRNEKPRHCNQRVTPAHLQKKPTCSNEDSVQPKI